MNQDSEGNSTMHIQQTEHTLGQKDLAGSGMLMGTAPVSTQTPTVVQT